MAQLRPGRFSWDARNLGSNRWTIRLERIDENADSDTFFTYVAPSLRPRPHPQRAGEPGSERAYRAGDTIFDEGEVWPYIGIVKSGKVIYTLLSPDGKTHTIGERLTHDTLNESGTFDGGGATTRAEALTDATIVTLPSEGLIHAARNDAELALGFLIASSQARRRRSIRSRISHSPTCCNAWRSFCWATRARRSDGSRATRRRKSISGADRRRRGHRARHGRARVVTPQECERVELDRGRVRRSTELASRRSPTTCGAPGLDASRRILVHSLRPLRGLVT